MQVGFIGIGNMGKPMAGNVLQAGFDLTVHDLHRDAAGELLASGAKWAESPAALVKQVDVILLSLPGPPQVESVVFAQNGILAGLKPETTVIDMSTSSSELLHEIATAVQAKNGHILDAPVTGAVDGAQAGKLTIFVGGETAVLEKYHSLLQTMGNVIHCGALGTGLAAKLVTNQLWFIHAVAIGEGLVLGAKAGIDLPTLWEIIKSSVGNSWVAEHDVPSIFAGHYDPSFSLDLCCKDLNLIHELGRQTAVPLELTGLVEQIFRRAQAQYGGHQGELHVVKLLEDTTGVSLQPGDEAA